MAGAMARIPRKCECSAEAGGRILVKMSVWPKPRAEFILKMSVWPRPGTEFLVKTVLRYRCYTTIAAIQALRYNCCDTGATLQLLCYNCCETGATLQLLRYRCYGTIAAYKPFLWSSMSSNFSCSNLMSSVESENQGMPFFVRFIAKARGYHYD